MTNPRIDIFSKLLEIKDTFYMDSLKEVGEAEEEPEEEKEVEEVPPAETAPPVGEEVPEGEIPAGGMGGEAGMGDMGMGGMGLGMGEEEEIKTPTQLGRTYELNKIYFRLLTIYKILQNTSDPNLSRIKEMVGEAFDIYKLILSNIKSYEEKVDDVILKYYEFIGGCAIVLQKYFKEKEAKIQQVRAEQT